MIFEISSNLEISPEVVSELFTMKGVNRELSPLIRMTAPSEWSNKAIFEWPTGEVLFSSWILLFGILPIDRHESSFKVTDTVEFRCRLPIFTFLLTPVYRFVFKHRHHVLRSAYGGFFDTPRI